MRCATPISRAAPSAGIFTHTEPARVRVMVQPDARRPPYEADSFTYRVDVNGGDRRTECRRKPSFVDVLEGPRYPCHGHMLSPQLCFVSHFDICAARIALADT